MTKTRELALTEREYERLLIGATQLNGQSRQLEARAAILLGGRLGLRPGEVAHFSGDWVDRRREMIQIPEHEDCECGYCKDRAKHSGSDSLGEYWQPKTDAAVRDVPYAFSQRASVAIDLLTEDHGGYPNGYSTLQRRVNSALEAAPGLDQDSTTPHGLRATAASYHAGRGLDAGPLQSMFGWEDLATAKSYISVDGVMTARALGEVHG